MCCTILLADTRSCRKETPLKHMELCLVQCDCQALGMLLPAESVPMSVAFHAEALMPRMAGFSLPGLWRMLLVAAAGTRAGTAASTLGVCSAC